MKRVVSLCFCCVLLFPFLMVSVFAAESYVFNHYSGTIFSSEFELDNGLYSVSFFTEDTAPGFLWICDNVSVDFGDSTQCIVDVTFDRYVWYEFLDPDDYNIEELRLYDSVSCTLRFVRFGKQLAFSGSPSLTSAIRDVQTISLDLLELYKEDVSISSVVTSELVSGVLDNVVTLIPAVVGGLAIVVGARKGLAWLVNLIHGV